MLRWRFIKNTIRIEPQLYGARVAKADQKRLHLQEPPQQRVQEKSGMSRQMLSGWDLFKYLLTTMRLFLSPSLWTAKAEME